MFILFLFLTANDGTSHVTTSEFKTEKECKNAIINIFNNTKNEFQVKGICTRK